MDREWVPISTQGPVFVGEINGFLLHETHDLENDWQPCGGADFVEFEEVTRFQLGYIPEGSYARGPQAAPICPDGSEAGAFWELVDFSVGYLTGECALVNTAPQGAIVTATIDDEPALVVSRPSFINVNFTDTKVAFLTDHGCVLVEAHRLPTNTVVEIAEAIDCLDC